MVSQQAAPNLLPLLDSEMKPEKVVLMVSPQMQGQADYLEQVIRPRGIKVVQQKLDILDDFDDMQNQMIPLLENEPADEIALNATGGNKWMAMAAQEVFRMNGSGVFYVKVEDDKVLFMGGNPASHNLSQHIDLKSYIQAYGFEFRKESPVTGLSQELRDLCKSLVLKVDEWQDAIGQLNLLASEADRRNALTVSIESILKYRDPQLSLLFNECTAAGVLSGKVKDQLQFADAQAREFANGGWLESYVGSRLNELKGEGVIQDSPRMNQHIQRCGATSHNELDVCFMARNRLHLIECKTKRMTGKGASQMTTETVYKLDSISELGGLGTKSMLVSYRNLNRADLQRARDLRIKVVQGTEIKDLKSKLKEWIRQ